MYIDQDIFKECDTRQKNIAKNIDYKNTYAIVS